MAAPHMMDTPRLLEQQLADASPDLPRQMIATFANAMLSAQADQARGAGYGERSPERTNRRNGYRAREWDTRAGTQAAAPPPALLTDAEVYAMIDSLGNVGRALNRANPARMHKIYEELRLELIYDPQAKAVDAAIRPLGGIVRVSEGGFAH